LHQPPSITGKDRELTDIGIGLPPLVPPDYGYGYRFEGGRMLNSGFLIKRCWELFTAGVIVQILAPDLKIADHKFVMPASNPGTEITVPEALVNKEGRMHLAAALLVVGGAHQVWDFVCRFSF